METSTVGSMNAYYPVLFNAGLPALVYPLYRYFSQIRATHLVKDFKPEMVSEAKRLVKTNGVYRGFASYFLSTALPITSNLLVSSSNPAATIIPLSLYVLSYPLKINSLLRSLELPGYVSLKDFANYPNLFFNRANYKGIWAYTRANLLYFIPFVNYYSHRIESARIAFILGHHYGHDFKKYTDAKHYLRTNNLLGAGRGYYNLPLHAYNLIFPISLYVFAYLGSSIK